MNDIKEIRTTIRRSVTRHICMRLPLVPGLADYILAFVTPQCASDAAVYASGFYELCQHVPRNIRLACRGGDLEVVKMAVARRPLTAKEHFRGVFEAIYARHQDVVEYLTKTFFVGNLWVSLVGMAAIGEPLEPEAPEALVGACIAGGLGRVKSLFEGHDYLYEARIAAIRAACRYGRLHIVKYLEQHVRVDEGAWIKACKSGNVALVEYIMRGMPLRSSGVTAAARHGHLAIVQLLHRGSPADLNVPLIRAVVHGHLDIVIWAISQGVDPSRQYWILLAAEYGRLHIIKHLATIAPIDATSAAVCRSKAEKAGYPRVATWFSRREAAAAAAVGVVAVPA